MQPPVSVVCATYRRPDAVARLLTALAAQDLERPFEVVLVDDGSGPDDVSRLREVVASSPLAVTLLLQERNAGAAAARNRGWAAAAAPVVAFTDDDCQPDPSWLREGLAALEPGVGAVVGRVRPNPAQADNARGWSRSLVVEDARFFQTANAFYRRADLEHVGGFDPRLARGGEDTDLGLRVVEQVGPVRFAPEALVLHDVRPVSPWQLARESATRWVDLPLVLKKHPQLRRLVMHRRLFWKPSHPPTILAVLGILVAPWQPWALLLTAFWVGARRRVSPRRLPGTFLIDVAEVVACLRGSLKHRVVVL